MISSPDGVIAFTPLNGASPVSITPSFELTQYADTTTVKPVDQDGYGRSTLKSFSIEQSGVIMGRFSNGAMRPLGQIALALFSNPQGLLKQGGTLFASSSNSGEQYVESQVLEVEVLLLQKDLKCRMSSCQRNLLT